MKLGVDVHGVMTENPKWFKFLTESVIRNGGEVHILTGPTMKQVEKELRELKLFRKYTGFHAGTFIETMEGNYTHLFSIVDYHQEIGTPMAQDSKGNWHLADLNHPPEYSNFLWDSTKANYCLKHGIDMMIDDSDPYSIYFKTPYSRYYSKNKRNHHINTDTLEK